MPDLPHPAWFALSAHASDRAHQLSLPAMPRADSHRSASAERDPAGLHSLPHEHSRLQYRSKVLPIRREEKTMAYTTENSPRLLVLQKEPLDLNQRRYTIVGRGIAVALLAL